MALLLRQKKNEIFKQVDRKLTLTKCFPLYYTLNKTIYVKKMLSFMWQRKKLIFIEREGANQETIMTQKLLEGERGF